MRSTTMLQNKRRTVIIIVLAIVIATSLSMLTLYSNRHQANTNTQQSLAQENQKQQTGQTQPETARTSQEEQLKFLIEEEKLAHDVYTKMYELYGAKVFGNILESESTHQSKVLALLSARKISDPRSSEIGVYNNPELQKLYDTLIAQGKQNAEEAYKVGVAIEEKDIRDISTQLSTATDTDIISTLESLRSGSENHLRAFNRQLANR